MCLDLKSLTGQKENWMDTFARAKQRWESIIIGDQPDFPKTDFGDITDTVCTEFPSTVDDVYICGMESVIDGLGNEGSNILGSAGPTFVRGSGVINPQTNEEYWTAVSAVMEFDTADIQMLLSNGKFENVILHEMAHALGFGTLWEENGVYIEGSGGYASGTYADAEWKRLGCSGPLPVELDFGEGIANGHWDEQCLINELMTGFGASQEPISRITIGSMQDIGLVVDYSQADAFTINNLGMCGAFCPAKKRSLRSGEGKVMLSSNNKDIIKRYAKPKLAKMHEAAIILQGTSGTGIMAKEEITVYYQDKGGNMHGVLVAWKDVKNM
jgi:hypothetical protein